MRTMELMIKNLVGCFGVVDRLFEINYFERYFVIVMGVAKQFPVAAF